jgi:hypothetical protein
MRLRPVPGQRGLALAVLLTLQATAAVSQSSTSIKGFVVDQNGNMGVGTKAPGATLHVAGDSLTDGLIKGGGLLGQFGSSAVISGFDNRYGQRPFLFSYDTTASGPQTAIQIYAVDPLDPTRSVFKTFVIDHPLARNRYLVHAALEGPEGAVYYRGTAKLENGRALVALPYYFEGLTRKEGRTVQLTNIDGFDMLAVRTRNGFKVSDGGFVVESSNRDSRQSFDWEVKAVRADAAPLAVEPLRTDISVNGFGPYTYAVPVAASRPKLSGLGEAGR